MVIDDINHSRNSLSVDLSGLRKMVGDMSEACARVKTDTIITFKS